PSAVGAGVLVNPDYTIASAGGFIVQLMPGATEEVTAKLEEKLENFPAVSSLIEAGNSPEEILQQLFDDEEIEVLEKSNVQYKCKCSKERMENAIKGLGEEEIKQMIEEDHGAEATCHFCNEVYHLTEAELETLL